MQHAGLQYGQGAANSHQSPPFAHADISQTNGGNTTSSLRQFRKKDGLEKNSSTDLNTSIGENSHIARVPPHNHYPARPNDYYRYHQYSDYNHPFKESAAQVKYSEIAESQPIQHVDHIPSALQKHKEPHKEFVEMCNISHQTHIKQNFPDSLSRQQSYPPDGGTVHHQYLHKEAQVHSGYKPESQYQQYPQVGKYNMPSQYRKYPPPPPPPPQPPENDFLAKLQRINPSMARSIMSDHHIRETQTNYPTTDQNRMYPQNQRYYPTHIQNNPSYNYHTMPQPYNYPSCNYKHPDYARANQMAVGGAQYPNINPHPDRSISPRRTYPDNLHLPINYGTSPQKISPNYSQYNPPEYAQHYQHRRASLPQDFYHQQPSCRSNPYMSNHQISPEPSDNRASSGLRDFLENWAEEEAPTEIAPIYKENIRIHNDASNEQQIFVINSSDIPQCLENVSLVPTENGQYIIKSGALDSSVVRIKETTENNGERTVNLQIVEATPKSDCMMTAATNNEEKCEDGDDEENNPKTVPYQENQTKDCDVEAKTSQVQDQEEATVTPSQCEESEEIAENIEETRQEESVIVCNEVSVIKDMPLIDEEHARRSPPVEDKATEEITEEIPEEREEIADTPRTPTPPPPPPPQTEEEKLIEKCEENKQMPKPEIEVPSDSNILTTTKRSQRIFSVDDIINNIGNSSNQSRRSSLQLTKLCDEENEEIPPTAVTAAKETEEEKIEETPEINEDKPEESNEEMEFMSAISVQEDSVILEIGGALVQLNINHFNGTKVLSVLPLSESLVIDVNGNYQDSEEIAEENEEEVTVDTEENSTQIEDDISSSVCQSEVVIGEDNAENEVVLDLNNSIEEEKEEKKKVEDAIEEEEKRKVEDAIEEKEKRKVEDAIEEQKKKVKNAIEEEEKEEKKKVKEEKKKINFSKERTKVKRKLSDDDIVKKPKFNEDEAVKPKKKEEPTPKLDVVKKNKSNDEEMKKTEEVKMKTNEVKKSEEVRMKTNEVKKGEEVKMKTNEIVVEKTEEDKKKIEENERPPNVSTKAAKKLYVNEVPLKKSNKTKTEENVNKVKKSMSKLEETVNKIKSLKEKSAAKEENRKKTDTVKKVVKKVTFNLDTEVREISDDPKKDEYDKKKLSWEEYYNRKRKSPPTCDNKKVMEDTVTSSGDVDDEVIEQVELSIENAIKDSNLKRSPPKMADNNWEEDTESPKMAEEKSEVIENKPSRNKCIIDVNEFNIKPMESSSTPSPVSSSQFSFNSEDDSLQVYKDVVDSKLNSLNIKIPKITKPKQIETSTTKKFSVLLERFLNKGTLNCNELEKVKKIIEFKRKIEEDLNKKCYEVRGERDYKDLKLHFRKVPEKRKKKRFRNLYTDDTSDDDESDSSRSEKGVGDYSVYQRNSQGVPKLIFKRKSGLPQPFVKLERSQAVELLAKKRKLY